MSSALSPPPLSQFDPYSKYLGEAAGGYRLSEVKEAGAMNQDL